MIAASIAASFASCQKQDVEIIEDGNVVSGLVFSSEKPAFDDMTKTEWTGETILGQQVIISVWLILVTIYGRMQTVLQRLMK